MRGIIVHSMCALLVSCLLLSTGCARRTLTLFRPSTGIISADCIHLASGFAVRHGEVCELRGDRIVVGHDVGPIEGCLRILGRNSTSTLQLPSKFDGLALFGSGAHLEISSVRVSSVSINAFVVADCGRVILDNMAFESVRARTLVAGSKVLVECRNIRLLDASEINCVLDIDKLAVLSDASVDADSEMKNTSRLELRNSV